MVEALRFLETIGKVVAHDGSDARARAELLDMARSFLETLRLAEPSADFFLSADGVRWGDRPIEGADAPWLDDLRVAGVAILAPPNDADGFQRWIDGLAAQLKIPVVAAPDIVTEGLDAEVESILEAEVAVAPPPAPEPPPTRAQTLQPEADLVWELHEQAFQSRPLSRSTAQAAVANLAGALGSAGLTAEPQIVCPLDEYSTVHALNTSLMAMKLSQHLAYSEEEMLQIGLAALLHDIGKSRLGNLPSVSRAMLSPDEQHVLREHPVEGAKLLLDAGPGFEMAAVVAYEHHMHWQQEGGYPARHYERTPHAFSRLVAVCDVYDVLREPRTFRAALTNEAALKYLQLQAGKALDPEMVTAFVDLASQPMPRIDIEGAEPPAEPHEIGWLPETGYDPDCEPRPVRL